MGLAAVEIQMGQFDFVYEHIASYAPTKRQYGNMHIRSTRTRHKIPVLRYLHAIRVRPTRDRAIEGMISGPELFWAYEIVPGARKARLIVSADEADEKESDRIERQFLKEILNRVAEEQGEDHPPPTLTPGHLYLRRCEPPMDVTHPTCKAAVDAGTLDSRFVSRILPWGFRLIVGR